MSLIEVPIEVERVPMSAEVCRLLREAERRIEDFQRDSRVPGFVPCDYERAYAFLSAVAAREPADGKLFCEWGSGFGVVTCLAALLGYDAIGIEINGDLVEAARRLAEDFEIPVDFVHGSFIPAGESIDAAGGFSWLETEEAATDAELGPEDFDVIFAYPWPDEELATEAMFERCAADGALLALCDGGSAFMLHRKTRQKVKGKRKK